VLRIGAGSLRHAEKYLKDCISDIIRAHLSPKRINCHFEDFKTVFLCHTPDHPGSWKNYRPDHTIRNRKYPPLRQCAGLCLIQPLIKHFTE
jgi:hypothetical protein